MLTELPPVKAGAGIEGALWTFESLIWAPEYINNDGDNNDKRRRRVDDDEDNSRKDKKED